MEVIIWQIFVILSIIFSYKVLNTNVVSKYVNPSIGLKIVVIAWAIFTIINLVFLSPLFIFQLGIIFVTYYFTKKYVKNS